MNDFAQELDHVVQFYETDAFLASVVAPYFGASARRRAPAIAVCTRQHLDAFSQTMKQAGHDVPELIAGERLVWRDADQLLQQLQTGNSVGAVAFEREIGQLVTGIAAQCEDQPLNVYGELVDLLWSSGRPAAAVDLEHLWNGLSARVPFNLMCAYRIEPGQTVSPHLSGVCDAHSQVLRPEHALGIEVIDDVRNLGLRHGEREMVQAQRSRDQSVGDGLRDDVAQKLFGLSQLGRSMHQHIPGALGEQFGEFVQHIDSALGTTMAYVQQISPAQLPATPLAGALAACARDLERRYGVACTVSVDPLFDEPERTRRELLFVIVREIIERAASEHGAERIDIKLESGAAGSQLTLSHGGDNMALLGSRDNPLRRLLYQAHALGLNPAVRPLLEGRIQLVCRW